MGRQAGSRPLPPALRGRGQLKPAQNTVPQKSTNSLETLRDTFSIFRLLDFAFVTPLDQEFRLSEGQR